MSVGSWRQSDLRGGWGPPPPSVRAVVHQARLGLAAARWGEALLFFVAGLLIGLAAAVLSGASLGDPQTWLVASVGAACIAACWRLEHRRSPIDVARRLDRRLRHQGALVTAFEAEGSPTPTPMAAWLSERVRTRLRTREALRSVLPSPVPPVAITLAAAFVLGLALERTRPEPERAAVALDQLAGGLVIELEEASVAALDEGERGSLDARTVGRVLDAKARARALERLAGERPVEAADLAGRLDGELASLESRLASAAPDVRDRVRSARTWLDAARGELGRLRDRPPEGGAPRPGEGAGPPETVVASGAGAPPIDGGAGGGEVAGAVDPGDAGGSADPRPPAGGEARGSDEPERGASGTLDLPPAYAGIVAGWIEARRRAMEEEP